MSNERKVMVALALLAANACLGDVFYWQGGTSWHSYDDSANWSLSADEYSNPDSRIPGATDSLWAFGYQNYMIAEKTHLMEVPKFATYLLANNLLDRM